MEMEMAPLTITLNVLLAKHLLPVPQTLSSSGLEVFVPDGGILLPGDTPWSTELQVNTATWPL